MANQDEGTIIKPKASKYRVESQPEILLVEPTNRCNLKCPMCRTHSIPKRMKRDMSFKEFKGILDQFDSLKTLNLWNNGEPFLNKDIFRMIKLAKSQGVEHVKICTNATLLDRKKSMKLLDTGLDYLSVSLDGASEETYAYFRKRSNFNKVLNNIKTLILLKNKLNLKKPLIEIQMIITRQNENQIKEMARLTKNLGADFLNLKTLYVNKKENLMYLPRQKRFWRYRSEGLLYKGDLNSRCQYPFTQMFVNCDGTAIPCCDFLVTDQKEQYALGNVLKESIGEVWNGKKYLQFRKKILTSRRLINECSRCSGSSRKLSYRCLPMNKWGAY